MTSNAMKKSMRNGIICGVLAMGIGTTSAFANGSGVTFTPVPSATAPTTTTPAGTTDAFTVIVGSEMRISAADILDLLKTIARKIEITLTVDDAKRAELLTALTRERIRQSDDLLSKGKTQQAVETLQKTLADQEYAIQISVVNKREDNEKTEVAEHYRSNIEALTWAMERVKNPTAKAALKRNIEKTKAKLAAPAGLATVTFEVETEKAEKDAEKKAENEKSGDSKAAKQVVQKERKEAMKKAKNERKAVHEKAKAERKAALEAGKKRKG